MKLRQKMALGVVAAMFAAAGVSFGAVGPVGTLSLNTNVGNGLQLLANTPNQQVQISLSTTQSATLDGEDLNIQINNGTAGPVLKSGDYQTGTVFATDNTFGGSGFDQAMISTPEAGIPPANQNFLLVESTTTSSGSVSGTGLVATITVDTTGFNAGQSFVINMLNTINLSSDFEWMIGQSSSGVLSASNSNLLFPSNTITLIAAAPEPMSAGLLLSGSVLLLKRRKK